MWLKLHGSRSNQLDELQLINQIAEFISTIIIISFMCFLFNLLLIMQIVIYVQPYFSPERDNSNVVPHSNSAYTSLRHCLCKPLSRWHLYGQASARRIG